MSKYFLGCRENEAGRDAATRRMMRNSAAGHKMRHHHLTIIPLGYVSPTYGMPCAAAAVATRGLLLTAGPKTILDLESILASSKGPVGVSRMPAGRPVVLRGNGKAVLAWATGFMQTRRYDDSQLVSPRRGGMLSGVEGRRALLCGVRLRPAFLTGR
jgi:hypothetical protein